LWSSDHKGRLIDGFRKHDLREQVADRLGITLSEYSPNQKTYMRKPRG